MLLSQWPPTRAGKTTGEAGSVKQGQGGGKTEKGGGRNYGKAVVGEDGSGGEDACQILPSPLSLL